MQNAVVWLARGGDRKGVEVCSRCVCVYAAVGGCAHTLYVSRQASTVSAKCACNRTQTAEAAAAQ